MKQALFGRIFSQAAFRHLGRAPVAESGNIAFRAAAIAAAVLLSSQAQMKAASADQINTIQPAASSEPAALYITICLWSQHRPSPLCREVPLTPGAAGPVFASMQACQEGQDKAVSRWIAEAGPAFGFTAMAGDGYRIEKQRCGPVAAADPL